MHNEFWLLKNSSKFHNNAKFNMSLGLYYNMLKVEIMLDKMLVEVIGIKKVGNNVA